MSALQEEADRLTEDTTRLATRRDVVAQQLDAVREQRDVVERELKEVGNRINTLAGSTDPINVSVALLPVVQGAHAQRERGGGSHPGNAKLLSVAGKPDVLRVRSGDEI